MDDSISLYWWCSKRPNTIYLYCLHGCRIFDQDFSCADSISILISSSETKVIEWLSVSYEIGTWLRVGGKTHGCAIRTDIERRCWMGWTVGLEVITISLKYQWESIGKYMNYCCCSAPTRISYGQIIRISNREINSSKYSLSTSNGGLRSKRVFCRFGLDGPITIYSIS